MLIKMLQLSLLLPPKLLLKLFTGEKKYAKNRIYPSPCFRAECRLHVFCQLNYLLIDLKMLHNTHYSNPSVSWNAAQPLRQQFKHRVIRLEFNDCSSTTGLPYKQIHHNMRRQGKKQLFKLWFEVCFSMDKISCIRLVFCLALQELSWLLKRKFQFHWNQIAPHILFLKNRNSLHQVGD